MKYSVGMMFNPQGVIDLKEVNKGFSFVSPLFAVFTAERGSWSLSPIFCFNDNSFGAFASLSLTKKQNVYLVGIKNPINRDSYLGIGYSLNVNYNSGLFVELGFSPEAWKPLLFFGVSISFMKQIKK